MIAKQSLGNWWHYPAAIALVVLATLLGHLTKPFLSITNIAMLYLICVVITSVLWGLGPSILTCALGVLAHDFFFVAPFLSLGPPDMQDIPTLIVLLLVGAIISYLTSSVRSQAREALRREHETATLYALSRSLSLTSDLEATIKAIIQRARDTFGYDTVVFLPDLKNSSLMTSHIDNQDIHINRDDHAAAALSFYQRKIVGQGTNTLSAARARYLPLNSARGAVGVLAIYTGNNSNQLTHEQLRLFEVFADLAAVSIERALLTNKVRDSQILEAKEKLQTALFSSITHDLRTPLVSIIGVLSSLREERMSLDENIKKNLIQVACEEAERLNHLISNLLDSSRIEAGSIKLQRQFSDIQEIINAALENLASSFTNHPVKTNIPSDLTLVSVDFGLITHVLVNILDNAFKYSPDGSPVEITAREMEDEVEVEIADRGIGIPEQDLAHVFDRFYRVQRAERVAGTGLGLSICKGIVEAHNGRISAENRPGGGTVIRLRLPIEEVILGR